MTKTQHRWKFFRAGGVDQVVLRTADDLRNLRTLDKKLWVALACPARGLEFDERTLALLDTDGNGRIRPPEILAAIDWIDDALVDLAALFEPSEDLPLASINRKTAVGEDLHAGAKLILRGLGKGGSDVISLADVSNSEAIFTNTTLNGDGIVPADSAGDDETRRAIEDVIDVMGAVPDRSKKPGVDLAKVNAFFDQVVARADWLDSGKDSAVLTLGEGTHAAAAALDAVRAKVDDYFARCRLAAFDARAVLMLAPTEAELSALGPQLLDVTSDDVAKLPLARPDPGRALPLAEGCNPAWSSRLLAFAATTVPAVLGARRTSLSESDWTTIKERLAPFAAWIAAKPAAAGVDLSKLGDDRIVSLARSDVRARVTDLIARDAALASQANQIESLEKLIRFRRDLVLLLRNFVSFESFYGKRPGIFQTGTLYIDARSCNLCLAVDDASRHALLAGNSQAYLVYCDCVRKADQAKRTIVAAVTGGDVDNLLVGRNGVFYDRAGADWDATITKIVENPISVRQAFWLPYKRFMRMVEETFAKRAKTADDESSKKVDMAAVEAGSVGKVDPPVGPNAAGPPKDKQPPANKPIDVGTVAAIGVAVGGIATFFSSILATFLGLGMWMPFGLFALVLAISGPSMFIAWLKLRQRNIGPILDANGWAVNTMARVNVPFGGALTDLASLPPGASRALRDPFAEKRTPWKTYVFLAALVTLGAFWFLGKLDRYLPDKARAATVLNHSVTVEGASQTTEPPPTK